MAGNGLHIRGGGGEILVGVLAVGEDDRGDLVRVAGQIGGAHPVVGLEDLNGLGVGRPLQGQDVVHALHLQGDGLVDLQDELVGILHQGVVNAHREGEHQTAVGPDGGHLDDGHVDLPQVAVFDQVGAVAHMGVHILNPVGVGQGAEIPVALKAIPPLHHAGAGQHSVQLVAHVAPGDYGDAQLLALLGAPGQLGRKHLGIADDRKAAEAHGHAVFDMRRRRPGSGHLAQQRLVANAVHSEYRSFLFSLIGIPF